MGPGENAGRPSTSGGGLVCAFKVESHNHPSAVEPLPGRSHRRRWHPPRHLRRSAARPIAVLDSLRFGEPGGDDAGSRGGGGSAGRVRYLLDGAVSGIGHYGNSIGVPTVGGEVYFEGPYEHNCLVQRDGPRPRPRASGSCASAAAGPRQTC